MAIGSATDRPVSRNSPKGKGFPLLDNPVHVAAAFALERKCVFRGGVRNRYRRNSPDMVLVDEPDVCVSGR